MYTIVLLVEKALSQVDVEQVTSLHEGADGQSFVVLVPADTEHRRFVEVLDDIALGRLREAAHDIDEESVPPREAVAAAQQALEASLGALRAAGAEATGELTPDNPLAMLKEVVERHHADEVIVLTEPHLVEESFRRDWASRARHTLGVPVLKLLAHG
jgi:hypothetical protein